MSNSDPAEVTEPMSTDDISAEELDELERLDRKASPPPWRRDFTTDVDMNLGAAARNALPKLLAEVRRLRAYAAKSIIDDEGLTHEIARLESELSRERAARREGEALEDPRNGPTADGQGVYPSPVSTLANGGEEALKLGVAWCDQIRSLESERDRLVRERDALTLRWRDAATESREEAGRIRRTVKDATDAEARCNLRAEMWDRCADELLNAFCPCVVGPVNDFGSGTTEDNDPNTGAVYDGESHGVREAPMPRPR